VADPDQHRQVRIESADFGLAVNYNVDEAPIFDGRLDLAGMVTKTIALEDVDRAFDELKAGDVIRSVIRL